MLRRLVLRMLGIGYIDEWGYYQERFAPEHATADLECKVREIERHLGLTELPKRKRRKKGHK